MNQEKVMPRMQHGSELGSLLRDALQKIPDIRVAILFGSAAQGRLTENSDADIAVAGNAVMSMDRRVELAVDLTKVAGREVDLVDMKAVSGLILQQILTKGVMLFKDPACYAALLKRMLFEQADMMPYTERVKRAHVERFLHG
jgi:predicted nucleotidyltransferase